MYCADATTLNELQIPPQQSPCVPEMVYEANNGTPTGTSTVGFRAATISPREANTILERRNNVAELDVNTAQQYRGDSIDTINETDAIARRNNEDSSRRLQERLHDTVFWKEQLEKEIADLIHAIDQLLRRKRALQNAVMVLDEAILICTDNINARQRRYGEDLQHDLVATELIKELDVLNKALALYRDAIKQIDDQIKRNRDVKQDLEMIWSDKHESSALLEQSGNLDVTSTNIQYFDGEARRHPIAAQSTVESWAQHSHDAILRGEHERVATGRLVTETINLVNDGTDSVLQQYHAVNAALQANLTKLQSELQTYRDKLKKVTDELSMNEILIDELRSAITDKTNYIKLVQTRLHLHNQRPGVENARDPAQEAMLNELAELERALDRLNEQLVTTENSVHKLQDDQLVLEKQILAKEHAIQIDRDHVVRHREEYPNETLLQGRLTN